MIFTYETQGAVTYLVCELEAADQIDALTLGMLSNNHIAGVAPVLYTEMNGERFLKFNISAKVSADQFFSGNMNRQRTLLALHNILNAICSADEYMIDMNCFSVIPEHIFLNVSSCETAMVCIPVVTQKDINAGVAEFLNQIMLSTQFDNNENTSYIDQIKAYLDDASFSVYGLKELVDRLQSGGFSQPPVNAAPSMGQQFPMPPVQTPPTPASAFDSTITMDEMQSIMANRPQQPMPPAPPVQPVQPMRVPTPQPQLPKQPVIPAAGRPINIVPPVAAPVPPVSPVAEKKEEKSVKPSKFSFGFSKSETKSAGGNAMGVAIPGQPVGTAAKSATPAVPEVKKSENASENGKKMSLFGLLANYNKENAELYKKQKAEAKAQKSTPKPEKKGSKKAAAPAVSGTPVAPATPVPQVPNRSPMTNPAQPQVFAQQQFRPMAQPVPVQNSFNETTVLSPLMAGGETTVLGATPGASDPCLFRIKTGERISINKPVFRIGKEKSYVDYFIADNTAISRSHANIHTENGEYFVEDTNSTNHTYLNGQLLNSKVKTKINSGDKIRLANEDFTFSV